MTDHTPHTTAEAVQYWYDAAAERREERDRLRAVVARIRQMTDHWEQQLPEVIRTPAVVSAIRAALEPAVPAGQAEAELRRLADKTQPTETRPPMDDAQAAAAIAPLEAAVRRHREQQRTEHHIAVLLEAADDLATVFGDPMVKHIGALGASHLRHRAREIEARRLAAGPPVPPVHGESVAALAGYTTDGHDTWDGDEQAGTEAHPPHHRWMVETRDNLADEWAPGMRFTDRAEAVARYETVSRNHPLWKDGTPVERRFVRETTTYTVEQPAADARQDGDS
ncbi:hypothetical protein ACIQSP_16590 [Streptomyces nigra]|uniref:hypothetical protein n=1 Tax=Streptomyces nigra TaxID=1827580 RepID=UPI003816C456